MAQVIEPVKKAAKRHLVGKDEIMEYLRVSDKGFKEFLDLGMPVRTVAGKYFAHIDNIDLFLRQITAVTQPPGSGEEQ